MRRILVTLLVFILSLSSQNTIHAFELPMVESFEITHNEIEVYGESTRVEFKIVVSHPFGIENSRIDVTLNSSTNNNLLSTLSRIDVPFNPNLNRVTFRGFIDIPRDTPPGVYAINASGVKNNAKAGYQYSTGIITAPKVRNLLGIESGLFVRLNGDLMLNYATFNGPTYDLYSGSTFLDTTRFNSQKQPNWRVGEIFNPKDYFELRDSSLELKIKTTTPSVCFSDGITLKLINEGYCSYSVYTSKTTNYLEFSYTRTVNILSAKNKVELIIDKIAGQIATDLPKTIQLSQVYSPASGYVLPKSESPSVCVATGFSVRIISGGTCTLSYQSPDTATYRASDVYFQTFEIVRTPQTLEFAPSSTVDLKSKTLTLSASASSGAAITFTAEPAANCTITGNTLNLLKAGNCAVTAQQAGTSTIAPISKSVTISITAKAAKELRTISCVKGSKKVSVTRAKPKCPKGYSRVR